MDWRIGWSVLAGFFSSALVGTVVQVILGYRFSKKLEAFKKDLSSDLFEKQTKFAWLHNERSRVLVRLYRLLWRVDKQFKGITRRVKSV
jgi:hypothetical protein